MIVMKVVKVMVDYCKRAFPICEEDYNFKGAS